MERERRIDDIGDHLEDHEFLAALFEEVCEDTKENFLTEGERPALLFVVTRLGAAVIRGDWDPDVDKEAIARSIHDSICRTAIKTGSEPVYDEPLAVLLIAEAWMVEFDEEETRRYPDEYVPPRLHPRRREILMVTFRTKNLSFSRNWPILRQGDNVALGEAKDLSGEGMESVWDIILTG